MFKLLFPDESRMIIFLSFVDVFKYHIKIMKIHVCVCGCMDETLCTLLNSQRLFIKLLYESSYKSGKRFFFLWKFEVSYNIMKM